MAIKFEQNWQRETSDEEVTAIVSSNKDFCLDYDSRFTQLTRELEGEQFKAKIICAKEKHISYMRNDKQVDASILDIVFLVRDPKDNQVYYTTLGIYVDKGRQSNQLHDFLALCLAQKSNALDETFEKLDYGKVITYYPNLAGCLLIIQVATSGYSGDYQKFKWKCYATDLRSQEEIESNVEQPEQIHNDLVWLKTVFQDRHNNVKQKKQTTANKTTPTVAQPAKVNSFTGKVEQQALDDDLPF